ncbi:MAG: asparagine synthase C-terminal domain-containing protein [Bacteroidales bacterium]|nr:asparagine synthase C-terminal domain-containing protein [Bacteroidales bacterium]MCF8390268.1 asparagine synthase C-terminal domain-containing protein [Bacteroidales bacterium]
MTEIVLIHKPWNRYQDKEISLDFIGYLDFEATLFLKADELVFFFRARNISVTDIQDFLVEQFLPKANGNFALVIQYESKCILACDYSRNFPLFIINDGLNKIITDHIGRISFKKEHDKLAQEEFLLSGLVIGNRTVYKNVKGLQAGEIATIVNGDMHFHRYFLPESDAFRLKLQTNIKTICEEMDNLLLSTFKRMILSCPKVNNWVVPLSGGHDSRLIINYLHRLGCKNVICFTYGHSTAKDVEISKIAASAVGYKWYFIESTSKDWDKIHAEKLFDRYINYSFNGCSLAHPLDFLAIYKLKEMGIINDNDIIVPGHTAFTETQNRIIKNLTTETQSLQYVFNKYYRLFKNKKKYPRFESTLRDVFKSGAQSIISFPDFFNWQERQSKYINNSVRAYEFFGMQWRLPFWEKNIIEFWQNINFEDRIERAILFTASKEYLFHEVLKDVPIINKFEKQQQSPKNYLKILPDIIISLLVGIIHRKAFVPQGQNLIFANKALSIKKIIGPMSLYPSNLKRYFKAILPRRPYQVNIVSLIAIYTLKNEVFSEFAKKRDDFHSKTD